MEFPLLVPVPPTPVRNLIPNEEWEAILDAWILLTQVRLQSSRHDLEQCAHANGFDYPFLSSFVAAMNDARLHHAGQKARQLGRSTFLLARRYFLEVQPMLDDLLDWRFLGDLSVCYHSNNALKELLSEAWSRYHEKISLSAESGKGSILKRLSASGPVASNLIADLRRITVLASALPAVGHILMTGSDFLDALYDAYRSRTGNNDSDAICSAVVANTYVGLTSLLKGPKPNMSLLLDHLFTLKVASGVGATAPKKHPNLLSDLICSTDMLSRMDRYLTSAPQKRGQDLVRDLRSYQQEMKDLHHRHQRHKRKEKGKGRISSTVVLGELHAHKLSLVTEIQDLFPDLGGGYVVRLLDCYGDNTETVIAHLLDDSLPSELKTLDTTEPLPHSQRVAAHDPMEPGATPPQLESPPLEPTFNRSIDVNDDDIVRAAYSGRASGKLHFGRANAASTADTILADRSQHATNKAAILSALAAFDSDDDERDDTYDVGDVGGTVDSLPAGTDTEAEQEKRNRADETEMTLFRLYKSSPAQFARDSATRRSQPRTSLKRETGMTDEAIEGWAVMLQRDPKKQSRLEGKLALAAGAGVAAAQPELDSTAYRRTKPKTAENSEEDDASDGGGPAAEGSRGRGRGGRGGSGGGRGGGGGTSRGGNRGGGGRGRGANHRRRDQHAKKMARAGGLPS